jgi:hypothetical protein
MWRIPNTRRERVAIAVAVLAISTLPAVSPLASETASASRITRAAVAYCIPPSTAKGAAAENAESTSSALSAFTEGSLASAGSLAVPVGASSAGTVSIALTHQKTQVGSGSAAVRESGCYQLTVTLTSKGRQLLSSDETSKTPVAIGIKSTFTPVKGSGKVATAVAMVTLQP